MAAWGHAQVVGGPLLALPYRRPVRNEEGAITGWKASSLYILPELIEVDGSLAPEYRYRGLHRVPVTATALPGNAKASCLEIALHSTREGSRG